MSGGERGRDDRPSPADGNVPPSDEFKRARLRPAPGADRAAAGGAAGRVAPARLARASGEAHRVVPPSSRRAPPRGRSWSSTTRASCLRGSRSSGRGARCCCSSGSGATEWEGLARPTRRLAGRAAATARSSCSSTSARAAGGCGSHGEPAGETPLPPYITAPLADPERYQTVYAREERLGGRADRRPPLHARAARAARRRARDAARRARHVPAARRGRRSRSTRSTASATRCGPRRGSGSARPTRVLAVGTTTVRVLETLARGGPLAGRTDLFVTPGFEFRRVDHLLTNFHLPRSTLLALVMAFAGIEETRRLYRLAVAGALPLLLLRRRHADPLTWMKSHRIRAMPGTGA